jgi:hypothetical protein
VGRDEDDEPRGFIDEVFEHRLRQPQRVEAGENGPTDDIPVGTDAGTDPLHPGIQPDEGDAGGSGVVAEDLGETVDVEPPPRAHELDPAELTIIDEAMKKSGIVWLDTGSGQTAQAAWYVWLEGAAYVLTGSGEQPDPGLADAAAVRVVARSKETRSLLVEWAGSATPVAPADENWDTVTAALAKARLNLPDPASAPERWAADPAIAVFRIAPTGPLAEAPGRYSDSSRRAAPLPTPATTAGAPPKVIHRRQTARRPLS